MDMEKAGFILLGAFAVIWLGIWLMAIFVGLIGFFPIGLLWLLPVGGISLLFIKALNDRMNNKEDDYYDKHIDL